MAKAKRRARPAPPASDSVSDSDRAAQFARTLSKGPTLADVPSVPPPDRPTPTQYMTADAMKHSGTYDAELFTRPGYLWKLRRVEAFDLFMKGVISTPLMTTVAKLDQMRAAIKTDPDEAVRNLSEDDKAEVMGLLREWAKAVCVNPAVVDREDGDPRHISLDLLTFWDLMAIMNATPVPNRAARLTEADAQEFRGTAPGMDGDAASNGQALRHAPERVPVDARPAIERA